MATISQSRALAGSRAFTVVKANSVARGPSNGSKYFMKRKDSFMLEVDVGMEETEDSAVRRYMRSVMGTGVLNELRYRKTKEPKIEKYKRELKQRIDAVKAGVKQPTWNELYGEGFSSMDQTSPFDELFRDPNDPGSIDAMLQTNLDPEDGLFAVIDNTGQQNWGQYVDTNAQSRFGGYRNDAGGYRTDMTSGGYRTDTGGYIN